MTLLPTYIFATDEHWAKGLSAGLGRPKLLDVGDGAEVPGVPHDIRLLAARGGELWYIDAAGHLRTGDLCGPLIPGAVALAVGRSRIWVLRRDLLFQFDRRTGQQILELSCLTASAMAGDGRDGAWVLCDAAPLLDDGHNQPRKQAVHIAADGHQRGKPMVLSGSVAQLASAGDALLTLDGDRLARITGKTWSLPIGDALRDGPVDWARFTPQTLASGRRFVLVAGLWDGNDGPKPGALLIDAEGALVGKLKWRDGTPTLVASDGGDVLALFDTLRRFSSLSTGGSLKLTPGLAPEALSGKWLRAEVEARLPLGASLSLRWAAVLDASIADTAQHTIGGANSELPASLRIASVRYLIAGLWNDALETYQGLERPPGEPVPLERFSFPLYKAAPGSTVFAELRLETDGAAPELVRLSVIHDSEGLMQYLPPIYRGPSGDADCTIRRLVGVLDTTTHGIDETITALDARLDPMRTAPGRLAALAAMLGLPFDEALTEDMQRRLVASGPRLLETRGTRAGIETLLEALFPGRPYRIVDRAAGLLALTLNGTTLPGLLLGPSPRQPKLNARLVLNKTPLCPPDGSDDGMVRTSAEVAVTVAATFAERRTLGTALRQMLNALLPAGLRLRLGWSAWRDGMAETAGDVLTVVDSPEDLKLGEGQTLGAARVGGRRDPRIPPDGFVPVGHRLL